MALANAPRSQEDQQGRESSRLCLARAASAAMRIYTKTGDCGETGLIGGRRIAKASPRIAGIGDIDELNACLGMCRVAAPPSDVALVLEPLQSLLFDVGAAIARPGAEIVLEAAVSMLEDSMD